MTTEVIGQEFPQLLCCYPERQLSGSECQREYRPSGRGRSLWYQEVWIMWNSLLWVLTLSILGQEKSQVDFSARPPPLILGEKNNSLECGTRLKKEETCRKSRGIFPFYRFFTLLLREKKPHFLKCLFFVYCFLWKWTKQSEFLPCGVFFFRCYILLL